MRFGIDFGTTHTVVALVDRGNYPIVSFEHGDVIRSGISARGGELRFGAVEPGWEVLRSFKRLLDDVRLDSQVLLDGRDHALAALLTGFLAPVPDTIPPNSNAA